MNLPYRRIESRTGKKYKIGEYQSPDGKSLMVEKEA
jgi:hypothetical protein